MRLAVALLIIGAVSEGRPDQPPPQATAVRRSYAKAEGLRYGCNSYGCNSYGPLDSTAGVAQAFRPAPDAQTISGPKPSQHGSISQRIADTRITIEYNRPVARGRELFGKLVPYGRIWCPCADDATTVEVSTNVKIDGQDLPAGKYSLWTEPHAERWTVIFNKAANVWHTRYPEGQDALRLQITPRTGAHMETLAFYFPVVDGRKAELVLHWGTLVVPMTIEVP